MRWPAGFKSAPQRAQAPVPPGAHRDRLAVLLALVTVICVVAAVILTDDTRFRRLLMPGPLVSAHSAIEDCGGCHTRSGSGKLSWLHGLIAGDPSADSKACLTCHTMPDSAFNPHSAAAEALKQSTQRMQRLATGAPAPRSMSAQSRAFPTHDIVADGLYCATCHQEHQGVKFDLTAISNEQCQSCHVLQFDSFDGHHPKFEDYPFRRRTRIVYDHAGHFDKHFPEVAKKEPTRRIPATCSTCHNSRGDKRVMALAPFEQTCSGCHLNQITGKERVSGPKGIAFLSLPGLDLQTLKKKASIGEWPDASEAELTPFMKLMIGGNERGRKLIKAVHGLSLQDLSGASDDQIRAVSDLVWEIKRLLFALIKEKTSDVLGGLDIGRRAKLRADLVSDLTARIPRDVLIAAQKTWLPNLASELANGPGASTPQPKGWSTVTSGAEPSAEQAATEPASRDEASGSDSQPEDTQREPVAATPPKTKRDGDGQACALRVLGQCLVFKTSKQEAGAPNSEGVARVPDAGQTGQGEQEAVSSIGKLPPPMRAGLNDARPAAQPSANATAAARKPEAGVEAVPAGKQPQGKAPAKGPQSDDLLFPTEDELRELRAFIKSTGQKVQPHKPSAGAAIEAPPDTAAANRPSQTGQEPGIESEMDPESWAETGGWYQHDHTIFYRPAGHKDEFIFSWLRLTGPHANDGETSPAAAVFDYLTSKDAQGSCAKCHSVDDVQDRGRSVNFSPLTVAHKQGQFTRFIHEPHFVAVGNQGCLTCHKLEGKQSYLKSYEQRNPRNFAAEFSSLQKDRCMSCHAGGMARQDCLLCHKYHVNDVITPITSTTLQAK